jgi:hypothetical protein
MFTQNMFLHKSNPMFAIVRNHTFPPFGGTTNIITLANKMANHITHSLKQNRMVYYHHSPQINAKGKTTCGEGPMFFNLG